MIKLTENISVILAPIISGLFGMLYIVLKTYRKKYNKLVTHPMHNSFFIKIKYMSEVYVPNITYYYDDKIVDVRGKLMRDMLKVKLKIWGDITKEIVMNIDYNKESSEIRIKFQEGLFDIIHEYEDRWINMGVPKIALIKFKEWHNSRVEVYLKTVDDIADSNSFSSNIEKVNAILEMHNNLLYLTIIDAEQSLNSMNGDLSGLKYKDMIIE